ncbi:hydrogen peroxide-inducible genes activator [Corynebacterium timonense]|uniref:Probable hydrogen peroxide-inducible genes activator n=1 Tax=Corynebacterium timonense TaxID=441500 RepID=A0A1H1ND90_9CORY|nr:hydrogen peroxide-inducible genes activator [Corynebacterium timonense]SDR96914.1 transcriptional regulator [Corynebacterium timonense]
MGNKEYRPTLAQLRTFVTIAENRHFGTAAHKLNISQPSLSQALVALESGLGVQLIERSTRKVIVTATGERLLPLAKATLEAAENFVAHSRGANGVLAGPLSIGIIPTLAPYILPEFLRLARESYPELKPRIVEDQTEQLIQQLRDGHIDIAILALPTNVPGITECPLFDEPFIVVTDASHEAAGHDDLSLDVLDDLNLLLLDDGHCLREQIVDLCRLVNAAPHADADSATRASSLTTIMQLVVAGLGSTLVPASAIATECARPGLGLATFDEGVVAQRTIGLVCRSSSSRTAAYEELGELVTQAHRQAVAKGEQLLKG